jgi:hypothetical protein
MLIFDIVLFRRAVNCSEEGKDDKTPYTPEEL